MEIIILFFQILPFKFIYPYVSIILLNIFNYIMDQHEHLLKLIFFNFILLLLKINKL